MTIHVPQVDDALASGKNVTLDITTVLKYFNQNQSDK
jgi:hypothetical protein